MLSKKTKKLFNNPKAFFRDSIILKQANKLVAKSMRFRPHSSKFEMLIEAHNFHSSLRETLSRNNKLIFIKAKPGEREVIVTTAATLKNLSFDLYQLNKNEVEVSFDGTDKLVKNISLEETFMMLLGRKVINIRFVHRETKLKIYFELQVWDENDDHLMAPKGNLVARKLWKHTIQQQRLFQCGEVRFLHEILGDIDENDCNFPVDYVFTWVNSADPDWQEMYRKHNPKVHSDANSLSRFVSRDELMYALRSIDLYAPWVQKIHIVSNCKSPDWLDVSNSRIHWVEHEKIFDAQDLPTFSSHAIETCIHKIPGLSNHFIYSNDDFILSRPVSKTDFFEPNGNCRVKLEPWGNVNGDVRSEDPDYLNAARNCQELLHIDFGIKPSQLHCHAPQAMRVDIINELEVKYLDSFKITRKNKFRRVNDIAVTGFLMHHYACLSGRGIKDYTPTLLIQRNHNYKDRFSLILKQKDLGLFENHKRYLSFCVNDGANSHLDDDWNISLQNFLDRYLPNKSSFEK